ncbi:MAG: hypothetical protein AAGF90_17675 [Pseudomonadota bacterium]
MIDYIKARIEKGPAQRVHHGFGLFDQKGREIGALVVTHVESRTADEMAVWRIEPHTIGTYFRAIVSASRDGKAFGATQNGKLFAEAKDAHAYIDARLKASRKAAEKKAAA